MAGTDAKDLGPRACKGVAALAVQIVRNLLKDYVQDGVVTAANLERILESVEKGTLALDQVLSAHEASCMAARRGQRLNARSNPYRRILVRPFEWMFAAGSMDRKHTAPFFDAAREILGEEMWAAGEAATKELVRGLLAVKGAGMTWEDLYSSDEGAAIMAAHTGALASALTQDGPARRFRQRMKTPAEDGDVLGPLEIDELVGAIVTAAKGLSKIVPAAGDAGKKKRAAA